MRLAMAQLDQRVGDVAANARAILDAVDSARRAHAQLVVTPELSVSGYPPEDLVLRPAFIDACARELAAIAGAIIAFFLLALTWSVLGWVDIVATAPGKIVPTGRSKVIQSLDSGIVQKS